MRVMITAVSLLLIGAPALATTVSYNGFADTTGLTLNGQATTVTTADGTVLRLTPALPSRAGSAFSSAQVDSTDFSTYFEFRITSPGGTLFDGNTETGADGIVFVVQPVSSSLGAAGQGIGYGGISPSVGVEFDTWHNSANNDPNSNHLGIDLNGNVNHGGGAPYTINISPRFDDGNKWYAWIDYQSGVLEARLSQTAVRPTAATLSRSLDLATIIGQNTAFVGFTSGTGADWGNHDIIRWQYTRYDPSGAGFVPEPLTATGVLLACAALGRYRRKRQAAPRA